MFRQHRDRRERFFGGGRKENLFQKGDLKYVILDLLRERPYHGYEIIREMEDASMGMYKPSPGVVYPTLQMLEDMGYATCSEIDGKKVFSITPEGQAFLKERKDAADVVRNHMKNLWGFKNIGRVAELMKDLHEIEEVMGRNFKKLDEDKAGRIRVIMARAYEEISRIIAE